MKLCCTLTVLVVGDSDTSEGERDREEFVAEHVDSGKAGKLGDEMELAGRWWEIGGSGAGRGLGSGRESVEDGGWGTVYREGSGGAGEHAFVMEKISLCCLGARVESEPSAHDRLCGGRSTQCHRCIHTARVTAVTQMPVA